MLNTNGPERLLFEGTGLPDRSSHHQQGIRSKPRNLIVSDRQDIENLDRRRTIVLAMRARHELQTSDALAERLVVTQ